MSIILTTQSPAFVAGTHLPVSTLLANPGETVVLDTVPLAPVQALKWMVTAVSQNKVRFFEVSAVCNINTDPRYNVFGDVGDRIQILPIVTKEIGGVSLSIINNDALDVSVSIARIHMVSQ